MKVELVTLFPGMLKSFFTDSIMARAIEGGQLEIAIHNLRDYCFDKHKQADDYRFGGGPGMLMKSEPFFRILEKIVSEAPSRPMIVFPTPQGKPFVQSDAIELAKKRHLVFICGHYKGIDQRVIERWVDRQYSLGDYVLTGGELPSAVIIDATVRLLPGVLGDFDSARGDSFYENLLDAPHYTRPEILDGRQIPGILSGGDHKNIERWRWAMSRFITGKRRPDILKKN